MTDTKCGESVHVYLVDTSVLTRLRHPQVAERLRELEDVRYSPISGLKYRFSASNEVQWDLLAEVLDGFAREPFGAGIFERADEVQRLLAVASLKGRKLADLLIAAQAEIAKLTVVHYDRDYDYISSVTGQPTLWIVAPGTID